MSLELNLMASKRTLLWFKLQASTVKLVKDSCSVPELLLKGFLHHNDVINAAALNPCKYHVHQSLEGDWCIAQPKRHDIKLVEAFWCAKCSLLFSLECQERCGKQKKAYIKMSDLW